MYNIQINIYTDKFVCVLLRTLPEHPYDLSGHPWYCMAANAKQQLESQALTFEGYKMYPYLTRFL